MAIPENDKHKAYTHYAAHCLYLMTAASDPDSHAIQREMAAEWLRLANAIRHPLESEQTISAISVGDVVIRCASAGPL